MRGVEKGEEDMSDQPETVLDRIEFERNVNSPGLWRVCGTPDGLTIIRHEEPVASVVPKLADWSSDDEEDGENEGERMRWHILHLHLRVHSLRPREV